MNALTTAIENIHRLIPFRNLLKLIVGFAVAVQIIVISVNHLTGFFELDGFTHFFIRLLRGSLLSMAALFIIMYPNLLIIRMLNMKIGWQNQVFYRVSLELLFTIITGAVIGAAFTFFAHLLSPYRDGLLVTMVYNMMIVMVCNIILMAILEAWIFFIEGNQSRQRSQELEAKVVSLRFEMLKKQLDSHFLFNSLNVLSSLIHKDADKAQDFIDEFSRLYRYVLESIDKRVARVEDEIRFARSYLILQKYRYGDGLQYSFDLSSEVMNGYIPSLSLQIVLENACKHNIVSKDQPLTITIRGEKDELITQNNIQLKKSGTRGTKTGQSNLMERYKLLGNAEPDFHIGTSHYTVTLPVIYEEG